MVVPTGTPDEYYCDWVFAYYGDGGNFADSTLWHLQTTYMQPATGIEDDDTKVGIRIPLGVDYIFAESPFDVFVEIAPILNLVPETEFDWSGGVGARFWF